MTKRTFNEVHGSKPFFFAAAMLATLALSACTHHKEQTAPAALPVDVVKVESMQLDRELRLPGEILGFQHIPIYAKVPGYIQWIGTDRGYAVKTGQLIITIYAPELESQCRKAQADVDADRSAVREAWAKVESALAEKNKAEAKWQADDVTYKRMKEASETPGVIAENEVDVMHQTALADQAALDSAHQMVKASYAALKTSQANVSSAEHALQTLENMKSYLKVYAPFNGWVTERNVHVGSFVGQPNDSVPMVRVEELSLLRLVVPVPEVATAGINEGDTINFTLPAYPGKKFSGILKRIGRYLDVKTRTMPCELDVKNPGWKFSPGMFPQVLWPEKRPYPTMFVPATAVASTTERTFVVRVRNGQAEWVDVRRGEPMGDLIEVFGDLQPGDLVAYRGSDEMRPGDKLAPKLVALPPNKERESGSTYYQYQD